MQPHFGGTFGSNAKESLTKESMPTCTPKPYPTLITLGSADPVQLHSKRNVKAVVRAYSLSKKRNEHAKAGAHRYTTAPKKPQNVGFGVGLLIGIVAIILLAFLAKFFIFLGLSSIFAWALVMLLMLLVLAVFVSWAVAYP